VSKKRGRPKKTETDDKKPAKRGRGRPRKEDVVIPDTKKFMKKAEKESEREIEEELSPKKNPIPANFANHLFKKGESGNPDGARKHHVERRLFKAATDKDFAELMQLLINGDVDALREISEEANAENKGANREKRFSVMQIMTARVALKIIATGNADAWEKFLTRTYGKPKENIAIDPKTLSALQGRVTIQMPSNGREVS
jgi:hypothetical protein